MQFPGTDRVSPELNSPVSGQESPNKPQNPTTSKTTQVAVRNFKNVMLSPWSGARACIRSVKDTYIVGLIGACVCAAFGFIGLPFAAIAHGVQKCYEKAQGVRAITLDDDFETVMQYSANDFKKLHEKGWLDDNGYGVLSKIQAKYVEKQAGLQTLQDKVNKSSDKHAATLQLLAQQDLVHGLKSFYDQYITKKLDAQKDPEAVKASYFQYFNDNLQKCLNDDDTLRLNRRAESNRSSLSYDNYLLSLYQQSK